MTEPWTALTLRDFAGSIAGRDVRAALMWVPTARDLNRILAVAHAVGNAPRLVDVGAGSGLLSALLAPHLQVTALDPGDAGIPSRRVGRFFDLVRAPVESYSGQAEVALVSWMEAGRDYRAPVAALAPVLVQAYDPSGGCGVLGDVDYARFGFQVVARWETPSWENVAHAFRTRGRGPGGAPLPRKEGWGNVVEVATRDARLMEALQAALRSPPARVAALPWEAELAALHLLPSDEN
ncbi:MAG TPA: hypothetical protein VNZ52_09700 [Candidatus Thermoplasmatota archaeon]|nr:hypothetical protein [Candidatus Thermoplasmatota archaeon]